MRVNKVITKFSVAVGDGGSDLRSAFVAFPRVWRRYPHDWEMQYGGLIDESLSRFQAEQLKHSTFSFYRTMLGIELRMPCK